MCNDAYIADFDFERETAYSREQNMPKQYVQNLITKDATRIYDLWIK